MNSIKTHLLLRNQNKHFQFSTLFISNYTPLGLWAYDNVPSPKYQKFKSVNYQFSNILQVDP